jgi:serine/threonine protein kinase
VTGINGLAELPAHGIVKVPGAEPLPEHRLLARLGKGGYGEVWKCEVPGGLIKAIKFVPCLTNPLAADGAPGSQELRALQHIKTIRHPFMLSVERVEIRGEELLVVMELADKNLAEVLADYQAAGKAGIPREELLAYLREAAEVLDFMSFEHQLQHLDIKPANLCVISNHIKIADFGLVHSVAPRQVEAMHAVSPLYAAPEIFEGKVSRFSDQYSLAITYQVLLTGTFPFQGTNARQLMLGHVTAEPKLEMVPPADRPLLARALAKCPEQRFPSCLDFIQSLTRGHDSRTMPIARAAAPPPKEEPALDESIDRETLARMAVLLARDSIPGYQFLECSRQHPLGDIWRVRAPDGRQRLAKSLNVASGSGPALVARLKQLKHAALPQTDILASPSGRIFLVVDQFSLTLRDRWKECRNDGLPGIPRQELLAYLGAVAGALDDLFHDLRLVHLNLNPHNVWLHHDRVLLFEFGLVPLLWPRGKPAGPVNSRYAAPELFEPLSAGGNKGRSEADLGLFGDQYSLALIYAEALTGLNPKSLRTGVRGGGSGPAKLNLDLLPAFDRPIIARALHSDPRQRFATCTELVQALQECIPAGGKTETSLFRKLPPLLPLPDGQPAAPEDSWPTAEKVISDWILAVSGAIHLGRLNQVQYLVLPGNVVEHRCPIRIIPGGLQLKLHDFPTQWQAQLLKQTDENFICRIPASRTLWQRCFQGASGMEVYVHLQPFDETSQLVEAIVRIQPYGTANARLAKEITEAGPVLIESVRAYLQPETGDRTYERWPCHVPLLVYPICSGASIAEPMQVAGKDISLGGIGFCAPRLPDADHFYISLPRESDSPGFAVLAHVRRQRPGADGWHEIGAAFGQASS